MAISTMITNKMITILAIPTTGFLLIPYLVICHYLQIQKYNKIIHSNKNIILDED